MIPISVVEPEVEFPLPTCEMPVTEEISEEGFGYFRGTWFIGRVPLVDAQAWVREEAEMIAWIDRNASSPEQYEQLASAIEEQNPSLLEEPLKSIAKANGLSEWLIDDDYEVPLGGLEIGVAGLAYALSSVRCLTAASCRWHINDDSWSDCPVVFFVAPKWRVEILAELIEAEECGLASGRGMLTVYGASVRSTHKLAERILSERQRFRVKPKRDNKVDRSPAKENRSMAEAHIQQALFLVQ